MKKITLKPKKDAAVRRFHPWVFSGAIATIADGIADGEAVEVYSSHNEYLATGHYQSGASISVRIFSFIKTDAQQDFWTQKIQNAYQYRTKLGLTQNPQTNCYRLIHAEGDGLPGLIVDIYNKTAVLQCHSIGMHAERKKITQALTQVFDNQLQAVYDKSADTLPEAYAQTIKNQYLIGQSEPTAQYALENDLAFKIDWEQGQKTGFFLDQRENRALLSSYVTNKTVLNAFAYTGGFSLYALRAAAAHVDSVDISQKATAILEENVHNAGFAHRHQAHSQDVLQFLQQTDQQYEVMVIDPPAFAKSIAKRHNAVQGYKRLNALAMQKITKGGILFTFSCSQVIDQQLFYDTMVAAALQAGRIARVMHHLSQPADHPVSLYHPEGAYLKGLVLYIE